MVAALPPADIDWTEIQRRVDAKAAGVQQLADLGFGGPKGTYTPRPVFSQAELMRAATSGAGAPLAPPTRTPADRAMLGSAARTPAIPSRAYGASPADRAMLGSAARTPAIPSRAYGASPADRAMLNTAAQPIGPASRRYGASPADRAMLQTAARTGAQAPMVRDTRGPGGNMLDIVAALENIGVAGAVPAGAATTQQGDIYNIVADLENNRAAIEAAAAAQQGAGVAPEDQWMVDRWGTGPYTDEQVLEWLATPQAQSLLGITGGAPAPAPEGPAPAPEGPAPAPEGPAPAPEGPAPAPAGPAAPAAPAPAPFPYVPAGGGPEAEQIVETGAANQIDIVEQALEEKGNAIADMVRSGMIDIGTAQDLYDSQRAQVYQDFLGEQNRIVSQFGADRRAGALERATDRAALEAQLRAAGVDPGLVRDEFAMMDEMYRGAGQEQADYLDAMGRIGRMGADERGMIGEGIFGGYRQDLRSRGRELGLGTEFEATEGRQLARERALQAGDLAPYLGVDPRAIAAGLYSGVDIPGMTEAGRGREWQTGERVGGQEWQTGERVGGEDWRTGERLGGQDWQTGERLGGQGFQAGESALDRGFRAGESALDRGFRAGESALGRDLSREELAQRASEAAAGRQFQRGESALDRSMRLGEAARQRSFERGESALDRAIRESQLDEQIRQFGVGQTWQERQFGELSAAQTAQQEMDEARMGEATRQFGVGQEWQERQFGELSEAQRQDLAVQQLGAGIDPATGEYLGFDPGDPYAAFSPQQRYQAMQENQLPLVALLPQVATPEQQEKISEVIQQLQTAAMGQPLTDEMVVSGLAADPELAQLIPLLMELQMQDWRTQVPGGVGPGGATMGPSAAGPLGPAPATAASTVVGDPRNTAYQWLDPQGQFEEATAGGAWGNYGRDPAYWVTPSDILRQNRAWGAEGSPLDRVIDPLASGVGLVASAADPAKWVERGRKGLGWLTGWGW